MGILLFIIHQVSWVRLTDKAILTVDDETFVSDHRIDAIHEENIGGLEGKERWTLQIKWVQI